VKTNKLSIIAVAVMIGAAPAVQAQTYNPFQIGGFGGVAFPTGDLGQISNTGYTIGVALGFRPYASPAGLRFDAAWNQFGIENGDGNINIPSFTGNVEYGLPLGMSFSPYLIGGAGLYHTSADVGGLSSTGSNDFGWNIGGGIRLPLSGFSTFIEARYNSVNGDNGTLTYVPVTFGITF
jgi:opacity protein-like surface antigen